MARSVDQVPYGASYVTIGRVEGGFVNSKNPRSDKLKLELGADDGLGVAYLVGRELQGGLPHMPVTGCNVVQCGKVSKVKPTSQTSLNTFGRTT